MKSKAALQLGMNPSTARNRLVKDILWSWIKELKCHRCGEPMSRDTFSIEHIQDWLDSKDPVQTFFDLTNIAFSHQSCNTSAARLGKTKYPEYKGVCPNTVPSAVAHNRLRDPEERKQRYDPDKRRGQYLRTGK